MLKEEIGKVLDKYFYPPPCNARFKKMYMNCFICGTAFEKRVWDAQKDRAAREIAEKNGRDGMNRKRRSKAEDKFVVLTEKQLAQQGLRIVKLTDVTVTRELLIKALAKTGKIAGNEIPAMADQLLKDMII